jgi:hypothetical protein
MDEERPGMMQEMGLRVKLKQQIQEGFSYLCVILDRSVSFAF